MGEYVEGAAGVGEGDGGCVSVRWSARRQSVRLRSATTGPQ